MDKRYNPISYTLWGEARGEIEEGIIAVASVIYNRTKKYLAIHEKDTPISAMYTVCLAPKQFSCWNANGSFGQEEPYNCDKWDIVCKITDQLTSGIFLPTVNATNYHAEYCHPHWADSMAFVKQIGKHLFYR